MKARNDFVTNSSSTSYICKITGHKETFWDSELYQDYGYVMCDNEHIFLAEFVLDDVDVLANKTLEQMKQEIIAYYQKRITYNDKWGWSSASDKAMLYDIERCNDDEIKAFYEDFYNDTNEFDVRLEQCPICQMEVIAQDDLKNYLSKKFGITEDEAFAFVKSKNKRRKKLYDHEYINYVCVQINITEDEIIKTIKECFNKNYQAFQNYLKE